MFLNAGDFFAGCFRAMLFVAGSTFAVTGVLATIAFLVVFRVLNRDFFWIVILISS
jgi:hypothetical protein